VPIAIDPRMNVRDLRCPTAAITCAMVEACWHRRPLTSSLATRLMNPVLVRHALGHDLAALRSLDLSRPAIARAPTEYTPEERAWFRGPVREGPR
jgi:hypothetical protein